METKKFAHRILVMIICLFMVVAYTPFGAFAETQGNSQNETSAQVEQTAHEESQTEDNGQTPEALTNAEQKPADTVTTGTAETKTADPEAVELNESDIQTGSEADEADNQAISASAEGTLAASEQIQAASNGNDENNESISDASMPAIYYLIAVLFKGIKKASLISSKYKLTFDGVTYYQNGNEYAYYSDTVSFTKESASIQHDKHENVILQWLFDGHRVDEQGKDIYTILDLDTARQTHTQIPGYTFKGSRNENMDLSIMMTWDDEEYDANDLSPYLLIAGVSATENTYKKAGSEVSAATDHSPATGDDQTVGMFGIMMCLSLLGMLLIALAARFRHV